MRGLLAHAALLAIPWLGSREPGAALAVLIWVLASQEHAPSSDRVDVPEQVRALALLATLVVALVTAHPPEHVVPTTSLLLAGFALRRWSIHTLGPAFTTAVRTAHPRVQQGPYRWLDHPSEVGLCLASLGFVGLCGSAYGLLAWALLVVVPSMARCHREDMAWASVSRRRPRPPGAP